MSLTRCTESITVDGTFVVESNTYIETKRIHVSAQGSVQIGTEQAPVSNVTIYLNHDSCESYVSSGSETWDYTADACLDKGQIKVEGNWHSHGVPRTAWTLLVDDCVNTGASTTDGHDCPDVLDGGTLPHQNFDGCGCADLKVDECDGWEAGDRVVVAYNLQRIPGPGTPRETKEHTVLSVTQHTDTGTCTVTLTAPTDVPHIGDNAYKTFANTLGDTIKLQAEVMNLERSIHITGPMHWRQPDEATGGQGIVTKAIGSGEVVMKWHRMSNCGRVLLDQYCHHFHHRHQAGGEITGAVVERSVSKGITVHGTSNTMLHANVIWNHRGAGIYYEVSITTLTQSLTQSLTLLSTKHNFQLDNVGGFLWPNGLQLHEFVVGHGVVMLVLTVPPCALCKEVPLRPTLLQIVAVTEVVYGLGKLVANGPLGVVRLAILVLYILLPRHPRLKGCLQVLTNVLLRRVHSQATEALRVVDTLHHGVKRNAQAVHGIAVVLAALGLALLTLQVPPIACPPLLRALVPLLAYAALGTVIVLAFAIFVLFSGLETSNACLPFLSLAMLQVLIAMLFTSLDKDWCLSLH
jgi:hypothetical protein